MDLETRFWSKVSQQDGCWTWNSSKQRYGKFHMGTNKNKKTVLAHRMAFHLAIGPIPPDLNVLHTCDNGHCVNPDHLFLGTQSDNMRDRQTKGRWTSPALRGFKNPAAKLTEKQVEDIRSRYAVGNTKQHELAAEYGITQSNVSMIVHGRIWV